jgi:hypothetical protein
MNTKRFLSAATMLIVTASLLLAACAPTAPAKDNQAEKLLGSWNADITTPSQGTFPALFTFSGDGSVITAESPLPFESSGHGNWNSKTPGEVAYTFMALFGSEEGKNTGKLKVAGTLNLNADNTSWSGPFKIDVFDATGQVIFSDNGMLNLTRITVESIQPAE